MVPLWTVAVTSVLFLFGLTTGTHFLTLVFVHNVDKYKGRYFFALVFAVVVTQFCLAYLFTRSDEKSVFSVSYALLFLQLFLTAVLGPLMMLSSLANDLLPRWLTRPSNSLFVFRVLLVVVLYATLAYWANRVLPSSAPNGGLLVAVVPKVASVGAIAMGMITGYAAFTTPYNCLLPFLVKGRSEQTAAYVGALQRRQRHLLTLWGKKQATLFLLLNRPPSNDERKEGSSSSLLSGWFSGGSSSNSTSAAVEALHSECDGIRSVSSLVYFQTHEAEELLQYAQLGSQRSWRGTLSFITGILLSLFALGKVVYTALIHLPTWMLPAVLASSSTHSWDSGSEGFGAIAEDMAPSAVASFAGTLTTVLSVALVVVAIRGFLLVVFRLTSSFASSLRPVTMLYLFATFMGAYFMAQFVLWGSNVGVRNNIGTLGDDGYRSLPIGKLRSINSLSFSLSFVLSGIIRRYVLRESFVVE